MACDEGTTKTGITPQDILDGELYGVLKKAAGEASALSPNVVLEKIRAAEDFYERDLQVFLGEKRVKSEPMTRTDVAPDSWDVEEPAYNYPDDFFVDRRHGYLDLNYRPVKEITTFFFAWPGRPTPFRVFNFLPDWVRLDKKFGRFYLVPPVTTGAVGTAGLSAFLLSQLTGRHGLPQALFIDYTTGLDKQTLARDHNDLLEAIRIRTTLFLFGILSNVRTRGLASQSVNTDGLSRSQSPGSGKWGPYSGAIELAMSHEAEIREGWRRAERGIQLAVMTG